MTRAGAGAWGGSARNKELGYPAYKDDPEWQRLDAEYNRIRQERLSPSAEQAAREEYEAYMADVFPEGDAAAAERAELELLADADRDARREAERMGEYEQLEEPIKDGDKTGWNYVSFRDDNIRVDHKWVDGQIRFARAIVGGKETAVVSGYPLSIRDARNPDKVLPLLSKIVGKSAAQIGEMKLTRINEKSMEHLLNSGAAKDAKHGSSRSDKRMWRGRVGGISVIDDIVATSGLGKEEKPNHLNKEWKKDAKFYRADTRFAIATDKGYEIYPCQLLVVEFKGGERFVYDLTEIKSPTLSASAGGANLALEQVRTGESAIDGDSISYSGAKSQGENEKTFRLSRPVERRKDLIAVHNMDAEGLAGADKLGGLEKPIQINPPIR